MLQHFFSTLHQIPPFLFPHLTSSPLIHLYSLDREAIHLLNHTILPKFIMAPTSTIALLQRMLIQQPSWPRDDVFDAVLLLRSLFSLFYGIVAGTLALPGLPTFVSFIMLNVLSASSWLNWQNINVEEIEAEGGNSQQTLSQEGMNSSMPLFLMTWIIVYTIVHG